jgi:hypothetical protein
VVGTVLAGRDGLVGDVACGAEWHRRGRPTANRQLQAGGHRVAGAGGDEWEYTPVGGGPCSDMRCRGEDAGTPARRPTNARSATDAGRARRG